MQLTRSLHKLIGLTKREVARFLKVPLQTVGSSLVSSLLYIVIFGAALGTSLSANRELPYLAFLIPGLLAMALIKGAFENSSSSLISSKYRSELQDFRVTPLDPIHIVSAISIASLFRGVVVAIATYIVGAFCYFLLFDSLLTIAHPLLLLYFLVTSGVAFANIGTLISMKCHTFEQIGAVSSFVLTPLTYLGGIFFKTSTLPPLWEKASEFNPLFYSISGIRYAIIDSSDAPLPLCMGVTLALALVSFLLALRALRFGKSFYQA